MKLIVHNMLTSKFVKGVTGTGFPLKIVSTQTDVKETDYNQEFVKKHLAKIDYSALRQAAINLGHGNDLPETLPADDQLSGAGDGEGNPILRKIHVMEGYLECPETGRQFPIKNGIPNMLVNEDEVA